MRAIRFQLMPLWVCAKDSYLTGGALTEALKLIIKLQSSTHTFIPSISISQRKAPFVIESKEDTGCSELIRKGVSYLLPHLSLLSFIRLFRKENSLLEESSRKWIHNLKNFKWGIILDKPWRYGGKRKKEAMNPQIVRKNSTERFFSSFKY